MYSIMAENRIIFDFDNDNRPIREEKIEGKLFESQYKQALTQIESYLRELDLEKIEETQGHTDGKVYTEQIGKDIDYNNNIFAFVGDRGTGKTSCMISVAGMLIEKKEDLIDKLPFVKKDKFVTIDLIDPAYFDRSHNLLSLFLAKLYKSFSQELDRKEGRKDKPGEAHISTSDKQSFLHFYREAHSQLHRLYHEKQKDNFSDEDLMEFVEDASASVNLKKTIKDLIDAYFDCFHWKDTILILRIDDVDMDFEKASEMIESMRKYFVQPNMLVFVSCSLEQLRIIKTRDFQEEIKAVASREWCEELADRYLAKVFPQSHCIQMPAPATYHEYKLLVNGKFSTEAGKNVLNEEEACASDKEKKKDDKRSSREFVSVKQALPELILKKTRYLFYNTNYYESYIVPQNLRELRQLMKLLITMPDYRLNGDEYPHNKILFKEYFYDTWVQFNLDEVDRKYVRKLQSVHDISLLNNTLRVIIEERFLEDANAEPKEKDAKKRELQNRHTSTADILAVISEIEPRLVEERDRKFLFFVKSYYSMMLYDAYCEILGDLDNNKKRKLERDREGIDGKTSSQIIRRDKLSEFYDYEKMAGGCFLHLSNPQSVVLNAQRFKGFVDDCIDLCAKTVLTKEENSKILLAELLILSVNYARKNDADGNIDYFAQMKSLPNKDSHPQLVINIGALLFNMTRYDQSIFRYSEKFYKALNESPSHKSFKKLITEKESEKNDYGYIQRVSLRNFEVLQDILNEYKDTTDRSVPRLFFKELEFLAGYSFPMYEYDNGKEEYNRIRLTFLKSIVEVIKLALHIPGLVSNLFDNSSTEEQGITNVTGSAETSVSDPAAGQVAGGSEAAE